MFGLGYIKIGALIGVAAVTWFAYGWGKQIIDNYGEMAAKIERLERDKALIESRVESYKTLLARRDAAIAASRCEEQIKKFIKDPSLIFDPKKPFSPDQGG